jgi:predicted dehydrogenase
VGTRAPGSGSSSSGVGRLRLGIAGTGFIGQMHARNAARSDAIALVAVGSARGADAAEPLAGELGVRGLSLQQLWGDDRVDAVLVATRTIDHAQHAVEVLRAGKHLLFEKPGSVDVRGQRQIAEEAARHPELVVRVAYHRRHDPRFRELWGLIEGGAIGEPLAVHSVSGEDFPPEEADRYSGGFIMDVGVHDFETARWMLRADPRTVYAYGHSTIYESGGPDNVYVTIGYERPATTVQLSRTSTVGLDIRFEVIGTEGVALLAPDRVGGGITITTARRAHEFPDDCRGAFPDAYPGELADFAAACRGEHAPGATLEDDYWAVATAVAARVSAALGEPLPVGPDHEERAGPTGSETACYPRCFAATRDRTLDSAQALIENRGRGEAEIDCANDFHLGLKLSSAAAMTDADSASSPTAARRAPNPTGARGASG